MPAAAQPSPDPRSFELFKLCVELADRTTARRAGANTFFVSLHSVIASVVGYLAAVHNQKSKTDHLSLATLALVGVILSFTWYALLRYYRRLGKAKWQVINDMELELSAQPFTLEWTHLHPGPAPSGRLAWLKRRHHREATVVEQVVPLTFVAVYVALGIRVLCS